MRNETATTWEAARILGVSPPRVRRLLLDGRIAGARRDGWAWRIPLPIRVEPREKGPKLRSAWTCCTDAADDYN